MIEAWLGCGFLMLLIIALVMVIYPLRRSRTMSFILIPIIIGFVAIAYWWWGALPNWQHHLQQQKALKQLQTALQEGLRPEEVIDKLKARLAKEPNSDKGWYLLGRLYASQGHWQLSHDAFLTAHRLKAADEQITVNYVQSLWQLNHQHFNDEIRALLRDILKNNKNQPDTLAMLAMDAFMRKSPQEAIDYWQRLLDLLPPQSEDANAIRKAIAKAQQDL